MKDRRCVLVLIILLLASTFCLADNVNFITALGIGTTDELHPYFFNSSNVSVGGLTVTAWDFSTGSWQLSQLTARNDTGSGVSLQDHGLGVCSAGIVDTTQGETCGSGTTRPGYLSELDNLNNLEILQISRTDNTKGSWNGIDLSSLDKNTPSGQIAPLDPYAYGQVFYSDKALTAGTTDPVTAFAKLICTFNYDSTGPLGNMPYGCVQGPDHPHGQFDASIVFMNGTVVGPVNSQYLYIIANNPNAASGPPSANPPFNDFLLQGASFNQPTTPIPEPESLLLLASGLGVMSIAVKKMRG